MKLNLSNENIREAFELGCEATESEVQAAKETLYRHLRGLDYICCYTQSVGAFVIFQGGTPEERAAFDAALEAAVADF